MIDVCDELKKMETSIWLPAVEIAEKLNKKIDVLISYHHGRLTDNIIKPTIEVIASPRAEYAYTVKVYCGGIRIANLRVGSQNPTIFAYAAIVREELACAMRASESMLLKHIKLKRDQISIPAPIYGVHLHYTDNSGVDWVRNFNYLKDAWNFFSDCLNCSGIESNAEHHAVMIGNRLLRLVFSGDYVIDPESIHNPGNLYFYLKDNEEGRKELTLQRHARKGSK